MNVYFDQPLDPATIHSDLFTLMDPSGKSVPAGVVYNEYPESNTYVLTLTPSGYAQSPPVYLQTVALYTAVLGGGIKSLAGDGQTELTTWSFQTNSSTDFTPPSFYGAISARAFDMGMVKLTWGPATDNPGGTPSNQLIYSICYSTNGFVCQNRFIPVIMNPSFTTDSNGIHSFTLKSLRPETTFYFLVRVEDLAGNRDSNTVTVTATTRAGKLYVSNFNTNEILAFDHPSRLFQTGISRSIKASLNGLSDPYGMFYDSVNDRLYISTCKTYSIYSLIESPNPVACQPGTSQVAVYDNTSTLPGRDQKPDRTIVNSGLNGPVGLFLDNSPGKDTLYVANFVGKSVTIYDNVTVSCQSYISANGTNGTCIVPWRSNFTSKDLTTPFGIAFDYQKNLLYVSNYINTYPVLNTATNLIDPLKPGTMLAVFSGSVLTASSSPKTIAATKTVNGFNSPAGLWMDVSTDTLYVANSGAFWSVAGANYPGIISICNASSLTSNYPSATSPCTSASSPVSAQALAGSKTGFAVPVQMALSDRLNSSSNDLYVSDYAGNAIEVFSPNPFFSTTTVSYNTSPQYALYGLNSQVRKPVGLAVRSALGKDDLYTASSGQAQILFFDRIAQSYSQCTGSAPPLICTFLQQRIIASSVSGTTGIFLDNSLDSSGNRKDRLYISNFYINSIVVFDGASTLTGNSYNAISKIITSSALQSPFGIYVDTSQPSGEWVYVVNSRKDNTGRYAVLVFNLAACPPDPDPKRCDMAPVRTIYSSDFMNPAGIWVDEGLDANQKPRDILFVSNRGQTTFSSSGAILMFNNSSILNGTVSADKKIQGTPSQYDQTTLLTPAGLFMDTANDQLYVANEAYNDIVVFNQPQACPADPATKICNIPPDRIIFNTGNISASLDSPSAVAVDFSSNLMFVSNLGLANYPALGLFYSPFLLEFSQASTANGNSLVLNYFFSNNLGPLQITHLDLPVSIALDSYR